MQSGKKIAIILVFVLFFIQTITNAQETYWVFLKDKAGSSFLPHEYFDIKAIERRVNSGIPIIDSSDFPINQVYLKTIQSVADSVIFASRWLNAIGIEANSTQISDIQKLNFIKNIKKINSEAKLCTHFYDTTLTISEKSLLKKQTSHLEANFFSRNNYNGKGIRIAVFDGGFPGVNQIPVFEHIIQNKKILATYDFARKRENVFQNNPHGTAVLSCIAGKSGNTNLGLAPEAEFLLARTEINREPKQEEIYWVAALEWADKHGVQIVSSSLGYTYHRYIPEEMDGKTSIVAKAAQMAASKGILIVNSMGNDGNNEWKVLSTPADADSIISVGAVDPKTLYHSNFSSFGPTADFRLKPNVVANGKVIAAGQKGLKTFTGTSFSTPLISGFAACVWQMHPEYTNMQVIEEIQKSASLYPYYDYAHGYGIPKASYFFSDPKNLPQKSFTVKKTKNSIIITFEKNCSEKRISTDYLYFHFADEKNRVQEYSVIEMDDIDNYEINYKEYNRNWTIRIFCRGNVKEFKISEL